MKRMKVLFLFIVLNVLLVFPGASFAAEKINIYHVPPRVLTSIINNSFGQKRAIILWKSSELESRKVMADYSDIEKAKPGSIISISMDDNYSRLARYISVHGPFAFKTLLVKQAKGASLEDILAKLGANKINQYPYVILLSEDNKIDSQGKMFVDFVVDYLFVDGTGHNKERRKFLP